jgi:carboxypeptidase family protein
MRFTHTFTNPEVMVPLTSDVHRWMAAYVGVMAHPFFAVTAADGSFTISGVPPGTYTLDAWHERLGAVTQDVTVAAGESSTLSFTFENR